MSPSFPSEAVSDASSATVSAFPVSQRAAVPREPVAPLSSGARLVGRCRLRPTAPADGFGNTGRGGQPAPAEPGAWNGEADLATRSGVRTVVRLTTGAAQRPNLAVARPSSPPRPRPLFGRPRPVRKTRRSRCPAGRRRTATRRERPPRWPRRPSSRSSFRRRLADRTSSRRSTRASWTPSRHRLAATLRRLPRPTRSPNSEDC